MKIFIDAGANNSCSARLFRHLYDPNKDFYIYSFEVDPRFKDCFDNIYNITFLNKAVWVEDGESAFYRSYTRRHCGGTLMEDKVSGLLDKEHPIVIKTINFSKWVTDTFNKDDFIILKMDIEGAEYEVLNKMLEEGSFDYINELWIEWHGPKIKLREGVHEDLVKKIKVPIKKWEGIETAEKLLGKNYLNKEY